MKWSRDGFDVLRCKESKPLCQGLLTLRRAHFKNAKVVFRFERKISRLLKIVFESPRGMSVRPNPVM